MTPQELKNSILQLAIQGKLVEQRAEESTGEELYQQIQEEKQRLIKAGIIKKEKPLPEISENEIPFDIPESWKWIRLRSVCTKIVDGDHNPPSGVPYTTDYLMLSAQNINNDDIISLDQVRYLTPEVYEKVNERTQAQVGDIFLTIVGTLGRSCVYQGGYNLCFQRSVSVITTLIYNLYLKYALDSGYIQQFMVANATGTAQKGFYLKQLEQIVLPLPPLTEQRRIVAKIEELLPYIDRYEKAWSKLEDFNKRFPVDMQKSILQMAIQGKLVEQRPEEGTGEDLYRQIQAEKQSLIKSGTIKKEKPLPEITDSEIPFDIPESWKWVRLPSISSSCLGKMLDRQKNTGTPMPYLRNVNVRWGSFDLSDLLEMKFDDVDDDRFLIQRNDLVMCEGGEPGRCAVWTSDTPIHFQKACHRLRFHSELDAHFFYRVFCLYANNGLLNSLFTGTTIKHLTGQSLDKLVVPLPPISEQKRIVAKLEEILPLCERLK